MRYLSLTDILRLHFHIIEDFGGSHGVRDENRLKLLVAAPKQAVFGTKQYTTIFGKAAVYLRNIVGDHPFIDGNKRTGVTVCGIFLLMNGRQLNCTPKELEEFAVQVAVEHLDIPAIAEWLKTHGG